MPQYIFHKLDELRLLIESTVQLRQTTLEDDTIPAKKKRISTTEMERPFTFPVPVQDSKATMFEIPLQVIITPGSMEPLQTTENPLLPKRSTRGAPVLADETSTQIERLIKYNRTSDKRWDVTINLPSNITAANQLYCFFMGLTIPSDPSEVVISWLYQVMINPETHEQVPAQSCFEQGVSCTSWGTMFMELFEGISAAMAENIEVLGTQLQKRNVLAGLIDDSFVKYCNHPVVFSDLRRFQNKKPWYEGYGYKMANLKEYADSLYTATVKEAQASIEQTYKAYEKELARCKSEPCKPPCQKDCTDCTGAQAANAIVEKIVANDEENGCFWISDDAPLNCLTKFNRHKNSQTVKWPEKKTGRREPVIEDMVIRLKYLS